jgi:hypothetical protein
MSEKDKVKSPGGSRAGRVVLVLVVSSLVGVLAGAVLHNFRRSRETERELTRLKEKLEAGRRPAQQPARRVDPNERQAGMRGSKSESYRRDYRNIVAQVRRVTGAEGAAWEAAKAVLERHFEPMEKALDAFEKSPGWHPPNIQLVVASRLPTTLDELRAALGAEGWKKFDAWRQPKSGSAEVWRRPRYAYFLLPEEFRAVTAAGTAALRWNLAGASVRKLYSMLNLPRHERDELEAVLRDHLGRYTAAVGGVGGDAARPADAGKNVAAAILLTEEKLLKLLGKDKFRLYIKWRDALREPARGYFRPAKFPAAGGDRE